MKRLNFNYLLLGLVAALLFAVPGNAQIAQVTDASCTVATACVGGPGMHGCTSTEFSVQSDGWYVLRVSIDECGEENCTECQAEAYIYKAGEGELECVHTGCCGAQQTNVSLSKEITYILYCCKLDCDGDGCNDCNADDCTARATVSGLW